MTTRPGDPARDDHDLAEFGFDADGWLSVLRAGRQNLLGRLGGYELVAEVGRGGQGVVYRGRQPGTGREVALKRLVAGALSTEDERKRFEREIEAASALRHPGIVTVYGIEMAGGEPVLAMEWVDGVPITEWAAADGGRPIDAILRVFVLTCEAVAHAHRHGVIHRDLKPSNILVDRDDRPRVLDFGMAKLSRPEGGDSAAITGTGFAGTIAYASPEQIGQGAAAVDTRTDVYALGAILYELLAKRPAVPRDGQLEALVTAILRVDPQPPSQSNPRVSRELDHVVAAAIAKDRERRYESVDALSSDVRRFLEGAAVHAHPPSRWYRARKLVSRHRLAASLVAVIAILAMAFVVMTLRQAARLEIERDAALEARAGAAAAREMADKRREVAEASLTFLLEDIIGAADPASGGRDLSIGGALDRAAARVGMRLAGKPELEASVRTAIGEAYRKLARYRDAEREHRTSLELRRTSTQRDPSGPANAMVALARALVPQGKHAEARELLREARGLLIDGCPNSERMLGLVLDDLAGAGLQQGRFAESADLYRESLGIVERLEGPDSFSAASTRQNLAVALLYLGKSAEACVELRRALETQERHGGVESKGGDSLLTNLGWAEVLEGRTDEGVRLLRRAAAVCEKQYGSHPETASTLSVLARALTRAKELPEAEEVARRAVSMHRAASEAPRRELASALAGLARITLSRGNRGEAEELMGETQTMYAAIGSTEEAAAAGAELEAMRQAADSRPDSRSDSRSQK